MIEYQEKINAIDCLLLLSTDLKKNKTDKTMLLLNKLIASQVYNAIQNNSNLVEIDIGIGLLYIYIADNLEFKFIPSEKLKYLIFKSIRTNNDPLIESLGIELSNTILEKYKDIL